MEQRVPVISPTVLASAGQRFVGLTAPFSFVFITVTVMTVGWYWLSSRGPFRLAARRGDWRLVIAVLSSLGMLAFGVGIAMGQVVLGIAALIAGGLPGMALLIDGWPRSPEQ